MLENGGKGSKLWVNPQLHWASRSRTLPGIEALELWPKTCFGETCLDGSPDGNFQKFLEVSFSDHFRYGFFFLPNESWATFRKEYFGWTDSL